MVPLKKPVSSRNWTVAAAWPGAGSVNRSTRHNAPLTPLCGNERLNKSPVVSSDALDLRSCSVPARSGCAATLPAALAIFWATPWRVIHNRLSVCDRTACVIWKLPRSR
jgi:hypothetical protein